MEGSIPAAGSHGTVVCTEWMSSPDGRTVKAFIGAITLIVAKDALDFEPTGRDANWAIEVKGEREQFFIPGCQVKAVLFHPEGREVPAEFYLLD